MLVQGDRRSSPSEFSCYSLIALECLPSTLSTSVCVYQRTGSASWGRGEPRLHTRNTRVWCRLAARVQSPSIDGKAPRARARLRVHPTARLRVQSPRVARSPNIGGKAGQDCPIAAVRPYQRQSFSFSKHPLPRQPPPPPIKISSLEVDPATHTRNPTL